MKDIVAPLPPGEVEIAGFQAWGVWGLAALSVLYGLNVLTGYAIANASVQVDVGLSLRQVSLVASVYACAFAIGQVFAGALIDRLGARPALVSATALATLGVWVFSWADSFGSLLLSQVLLAAGACVARIGAGYVGGQWFGVAKVGLMFGLVQALAALSAAFGQTGVSLALQEVGWRDLARAAALVGLALLVASAVWIRDPLPEARRSGGLLRGVLGLREVARIPHMWVAGFWGAVSFGSQLALGVVWAPKILGAHGVAPQMANLGSALLWFGLAAGCLVWGPWSGHVRARKTPAIVGLALQLVALALTLWMQSGAILSVLLMFLFGMGSAAHMIAFAAAADIAPGDEAGASAAFVNAAMFTMGGGLIALPAYTLAADPTLADYGAAFEPFVILLAIALIVAILQRETHPRRA